MIRHAALAAVLPLAACATPGDYPSLAIRDVERAQGRFETAPPAPVAVPEIPVGTTGPVAERLAALGEAAEAAHSSFEQSTPGATRLVRAGAGAATGSTAWAAAQVALADLDSARSNTAIALGDLDTLMVATAVQLQDVSAIEEVRQRVLELIGEEDEVLARLREQVR